MRYNAQTDKNQPEIVEGLRKAGFAVLLLHRVGEGIPDLLVSSTEDMWLMEVKTEEGELNDKQKDWFRKWKGKKPYIIRNLEQALYITSKGRKPGASAATCQCTEKAHTSASAPTATE